ncbi:PilN domain-containing protein [Paraclostridium bifermentans]|uniref:PilN domain-containing protein n=1 Tax=Paraclostridium bifermentans TaxID=1490 RepID=UPI00359C5EBB
MENLNRINFFKENNSSKLNISIINIIITAVMILFVIINFFKVYEVSKLENEVNLNKENISLGKVDDLQNVNGVEISKLKKTIELMLDNSISDIEFQNKKIKLIGLSSEINKVNNYVEMLKSSPNIKNCNINSVTRQNEAYQFEINADIGDIDSNEI